jgi:hypothetical protein
MSLESPRGYYYTSRMMKSRTNRAFARLRNVPFLERENFPRDTGTSFSFRLVPPPASAGRTDPSIERRRWDEIVHSHATWPTAITRARARGQRRSFSRQNGAAFLSVSLLLISRGIHDK